MNETSNPASSEECTAQFLHHAAAFIRDGLRHTALLEPGELRGALRALELAGGNVELRLRVEGSRLRASLLALGADGEPDAELFAVEAETVPAHELC